RGDGCPDVNVSLSWDVNSCGVNSLIDMRVAQWDGTAWRDFGNGGTSGNTVSGKVISGTPVTSYGPFTFGSPNGANPLPIEIFGFRAVPVKNHVDISWSTLSESNTDYFTIEKSTDGLQFEKISTLKAAGNSSTEIKYSITDEH